MCVKQFQNVFAVVARLQPLARGKLGKHGGRTSEAKLPLIPSVAGTLST